jgi:hypothetical protein
VDEELAIATGVAKSFSMRLPHMSLVLVFALAALAVAAVIYGGLQSNKSSGEARWSSLMTGLVSAGVLIGIAQCIRLLLEINGKL